MNELDYRISGIFSVNSYGNWHYEYIYIQDFCGKEVIKSGHWTTREIEIWENIKDKNQSSIKFSSLEEAKDYLNKLIDQELIKPLKDVYGRIYYPKPNEV